MSKPTTLVATCPHCRVRHGFGFVNAYTYVTARSGNLVFDAMLFQCNGCAMPTVLTVARPDGFAVSWSQGRSFTSNYNENPYRVISISPEEPKPGEAPEFTPDNIAKIFDQACRALSTNDFDAAGMVFRKAIDVATKKLLRDAVPTDLDARLRDSFRDRIKWLKSKGVLTDQIADWATIVRLEGNDAAHEEEPYNKEDAEQLHRFTEVFLHYVFTMPGLVQKYRTPSGPA